MDTNSRLELIKEANELIDLLEIQIYQLLKNRAG